VDEGGDGEAPGDEYSIGGLVTRFRPRTVVEKMDRVVSSSGVAVSTSLSSDERNEGSALVSMEVRGGLPERLFDGPAEVVIAGYADEEAVASMTLRVRGRFSFRSGSFDDSGVGSEGDAVTDFDFLFLPLGLAVSNSFAFSNAPHALASSGVSSGVWGLWSRSIGAAFRNTSRAPWRPAIFRRLSQF
jgi:hypothetical protein